MKIIPSNKPTKFELPLKHKISFEAIFDYLETIAEDRNHLLNSFAVQLLDEYKNYPELKNGFDDASYLEKYNVQIDRLLDILFPELLQTNEIKAASIPFEFTTFKLSKRFKQILDEAGEDYTFELRDYASENIYIMACTFILHYCYDTYIDFKSPFYYDIPIKKTGVVKHYRTLYNGDFFKVAPSENAPKITEEDIKLLLDNFDNIDLWKEKFPPNSYNFSGFGIVNLFDVTQDQSISKIKQDLLRKDDNTFSKLEKSIGSLYNSKNIKIGFSSYNTQKSDILFKNFKNQNSFIQSDSCDEKCGEFFCSKVYKSLFEKGEIVSFSDMEKYGKSTNYNKFYKALKKHNIESVILIPLQIKDGLLNVLEITSSKKYELNSINANKLIDIIPVFKIAIRRFMDEYETKLESIIQENYTSLHPSVKWKFYEAVEEILLESEMNNTKINNLKDIVFKNVIPLYGQSDIKGSSTARNIAIQEDLIKQLNLAQVIIKKAHEKYKLPIYNDLLFRIDECQKNIKKGLSSGDENMLTDFLQKDIYPVFNHLKTIDSGLKEAICNYMNEIDDKLHVIYDKRKKYDESVNTLNETLASFIDTKQEEAQAMFPHYFERYKTDGIDYNMYIGQSLVKNHTYNSLYLENLRLWQLQMMCEVERKAHELKNVLEYPLEIASLILVHSNPLAIKFRMDEKKFDVDGAYNIRYEIIKKRIDKVNIKNTNKRLTQPGKIAIVYSHEKDMKDYMKHIKYLQSKNFLLKEVENLELENLQGISGLKALRVAVNYNTNSNDKITYKKLMDVISNNN
jgi:hypothetical protein